jgi:DivIVA domain-containing protein
MTPEDVHNKKFTTVRLREGYDITEVDRFLDEVEVELSRLLQDNEVLRTRSGLAEAPRSSAETAPEFATPTEPPASPAEASTRAARLLEIAAANADQLIGEAREEADKLLSEAKMAAERLESDARTRSEKLDAETSDRRHQLFGELEQERESLSRTIDELRTLEQNFRAKLRSYFEAQLQVLAGNPEAHVTAVMLGEPETPTRLRELFGEDGG